MTGCLAITLLPLLFGWHPYVVKSGSMEPRIKVGDVSWPPRTTTRSPCSATSPSSTTRALPGTVKSHRVIADQPGRHADHQGRRQPDGRPACRSTVAHVHGIGRLLVRWAGLPMIWLRTGQYLFLGLFLLRPGSALPGRSPATPRTTTTTTTRTTTAPTPATTATRTATATRDGRRDRRRRPGGRHAVDPGRSAARRPCLERRARRRRTIAVRTLAGAAGIACSSSR